MATVVVVVYHVTIVAIGHGLQGEVCGHGEGEGGRGGDAGGLLEIKLLRRRYNMSLMVSLR